MKAVTIASGGMDSVTLMYYLKRQGLEQIVLSFDYGQRHRQELNWAMYHATQVGAEHHLVDVSALTELFSDSDSVLVNHNVDVPDGHYSEENMKATVVPNRNAIMLSIAYGVAVAQKAQMVAAAVHAGDHFIYPDCRPSFINALQSALALGNEGFRDPSLVIHTPFIYWSKAEIAHAGSELGVPYEHTWSCYKGGNVHCGRCGTCVERAEAFHLAGMQDPTIYEDPEYWKQAVKEHAATK
jgi:7-cyano-7-deazaguanine synthase